VRSALMLQSDEELASEVWGRYWTILLLVLSRSADSVGIFHVYVALCKCFVDDTNFHVRSGR